MSRARRTAAISVGLLLAAGTVTLAADDPIPTTPPTDAPGPVRAPVAAVPAEQAEHFAVLRRPARREDALPPRAQRVLGVGAGPQFGANPALARRAAVKDGVDDYLVPADGHLCLITSDGKGTCNRIDLAVAGYLVLVESRGTGAARVHVALPDGARRAAVLTAGGTTPVTVEGNVATADASGALEGITFEDAGGRPHRVALASPE